MKNLQIQISLFLLFFSGLFLQAQNLLLNPDFDFHSFTNHRNGEAVSYSSGNTAFWNTDSWGDIQVMRESHAPDSIRPSFSTHNMVAIKPGKKIWQFFTLPEAGLAHNDPISLKVFGYQGQPGALKAKIKLMKLDSEDGEWSPKEFGLKDQRTFPRHSRGEMVVAKEYSIASNQKGMVELIIDNALISGNFSAGNKSSSADMNTIGIRIEFENAGNNNDVWVYSPVLTSSETDLIPDYRVMIPYYTNIPRTIQKLWKGEPVHIIVMGSSIDRGSANPPMYLYDEDPSSATFKQPLAEGLFDSEKAGRPDLKGSFGEWRHYFSYAGRLKLELMRKFDLPSDRILLNFMAADGSCVGEAHSGLKDYCSLSIPPVPERNGNAGGKDWKETYPLLFSRQEGPGPDLVIFGSGANEKTDTPDEIAVFEGMIRWIQMHYPGCEFLACQAQNRGGNTSNPGDMQALSLRYQIPYLDYGKIGDDVTRWCNHYALVPADGHPQAAVHYLWFKQIEKAFECWDPVMPGQVQIQLPERVHSNTYGWEGEMITYDKSSKRIVGNKFILDDNAVNCWGKVDQNPPVPYIDGIKFMGRTSQPRRDLRNSLFRHGNVKLGDRHILEIDGENPELTFADSKICPNRRYFAADNPVWNKNNYKVQEFNSTWGAPYGTRLILLKPGQSLEAQVVCTDLSVAWVDMKNGGTLEVYVDDKMKLSQRSDVPFTDIKNNSEYIENRKGILNLGFGIHKIVLTAKESPVSFLGIFTYDSRPNLRSQRQLIGMAGGGEVLEFSLPFKARPVVICSGGLSVKNEDISISQVTFSGTSGSYQIFGE